MIRKEVSSIYAQQSRNLFVFISTVDKNIYVESDASIEGVGAVHYQEDEEETKKPISVFSTSLNSSQRNYPN